MPRVKKVSKLPKGQKGQKQLASRAYGASRARAHGQGIPRSMPKHEKMAWMWLGVALAKKWVKDTGYMRHMANLALEEAKKQEEAAFRHLRKVREETGEWLLTE